ncbi:DNA repair protein RadA [Candidatus Saccharibacteria bacterium]|nr:DNA repair protein RadA [Candidatus Saccharibacteria bacterium]
MSKKNIRYECNNCGAITATWTGKCQSCGQWNTLQEQLLIDSITKADIAGTPLKSTKLGSTAITSKEARLSSGINEVDTVLGGGFVVGSVTLIAGQPGIGKSTLLLQLASSIGKTTPVLYISGEESLHQVAMRAERLSVKSAMLELASSSSTDDIASTIAKGQFKLVIVDSIQTVSAKDVSSAPGSVSQITNSTHLLSAVSKNTNTALVLVGHVTKEGSIAGPKVLEHVVDTVLQLEGDRYGGFKILRGIKNRYGSTNEAGIFEMLDNGLRPVDNPSAALLAERQISDGSIVLATMEGSRPLLVEVQALVNKSSYGYPKRASSGIDLNRVNLLVAMLEKRTKLKLAEQDIYINIVGGIKINEPAADLAVAMAIASASKGMQLVQNCVVFGELGLSGEIRHVPYIDKRVQEAKKLGFEGAIGPMVRSTKSPSGLISVPDIRTALNKFLKT